MDPITIILIMVAFLAFMMWSSSRARKKQQEQQKRIQSSLEPGTWVRTIGGLYLRFVDRDGDVLVLETPEGHELFFAARAVVGPEEPPFAVVPEDGGAADTEAKVDSATDSQDSVDALVSGKENPENTEK
ncbi:MAG: preprotein translocase subunit YajC [Actinomycetaceae bacterium]|nr:preprotein translocase subunit YajC [Actinomycetaceae bacterium]